MRRSKKLIALLCVLTVVCLGAFAALHAETRQEQIRVSGEVVLEIPAENVTALSWGSEDTSLAFHKENGWVYDADEAFPVSAEKIEEMLGLFESFGAAFTIEAPEEPAQYGLEQPLCTIRLTAGEQTYTVQLGDYSKMDAQRYVSIGDGNVYLAAADPWELYQCTLQDVIQNDAVPEWDAVSALRVAGVQDTSVFYEKDSAAAVSAEDVYFSQQNGETVPLDSARVEAYLSALRTLALSDYVTYNATQDDLARCGLDDPALTVEVDYTESGASGEAGTFILALSRDPAQDDTADAAADSGAAAETGGGASTESDSAVTAEAAEADEEFTAYARVGESPILYRIPAETYRTLCAAGYDDLRHRSVFWANFADVTQIDLVLADAAYTFAADGKDDARTWRYQDEEIEIAALQTALQSLSAERFTDEAPTGKEELRLTLHLAPDGREASQMEICLYRYDGTDCLAVVGGQPVSLVPRAAAVDLIEAVNAIVLNESGGTSAP